MSRRADDPSITVRLRPELVERMDAACRSRLIGRRLLIETAIDQLCDRLLAEDDPAWCLDDSNELTVKVFCKACGGWSHPQVTEEQALAERNEHELTLVSAQEQTGEVR